MKTISCHIFLQMGQAPSKQLFDAVKRNDMREAERLLDEGADVKTEDDWVFVLQFNVFMLSVLKCMTLY